MYVNSFDVSKDLNATSCHFDLLLHHLNISIISIYLHASYKQY